MSKQISWIDANGVEHRLNKENKIRILKGLKGFYMPPVAYVDEEVPFQDGSRLRQMKVKARDMDLPIKIECDTPVELENKIEQILRIFNPIKADGKFKSVKDNGSQREIYCRYVSGFEMDESSSVSGETWQKAVGVFRAFDPFWYDSSTVVQTFTTGQTTPFFSSFPLRLSSSTVFADATIENQGDVEVWPEWMIKGPGNDIVLRNLTTGEITYLETSLGIGEWIVINTKPGEKLVLKSDGANLFPTMTDDSSLWALQEGSNVIRLEMSSATVDSSIQLSYRPRYWGP